MNAINFVDKIRVPKLFVEGTHCFLYPESQEMFNKALEPKDLLIIPDLDHQFCPKRQETMKEVVKWLSKIGL